MKYRTKIHALLALAVLLPLWLAAQSPRFEVEKFSINHGLSAGGITSLLIDSKGFLWIGTQDGINKYDGYEFFVYRNDHLDKSSISSNSVQAICEDSNGYIWIGTQVGLNRFDRKTGEFKHFLYNSDAPHTIRGDNIFSVFEDSQGQIWVKTENYLNKFDTQTQHFSAFQPMGRNLMFMITSNNSFDIFEDSRQNLWVGTAGGLSVFDRKTEQFKIYKRDSTKAGSISHKEARIIFEGSQNQLYIGTSHGLNRFDYESGKFSSFFFGGKQNNSPENEINAIYEGKDGKLWLGTMQGLLFFDKQTGEFEKFDSPQAPELKTARITAIISDSSGIVWVGTREGLYKIRREKPKFKLVSPNILKNENIRAVFVDKQERLWVGSRLNGLKIIDRKTGRVKHFRKEKRHNRISDNFVQVIYRDRENRIWLGTQSGVDIYDRESERFIAFDKKFGTQSQRYFKNNRVFCIFQDHENIFWFATKNGLVRFKLPTREFTLFEHKTRDSTSISSSEVFSVIETSDKQLWIGTLTGLDRFDRQTEHFVHYNQRNAPLRSLSNNCAQHLHEWYNSTIWVGTESGLNFFYPPHETFHFFRQQDGFSNDFIYAILHDKNKNLWVSTNKGISKFSTESWHITNYDIADGLQDYEFNFGAYYKAENGEFFFGGVSGLNSFFPDSIRKNENKPKLSITAIERINPDGKTKNYTDSVAEIVIESTDYMVTIYFSALEFTHPEKNRYKYMIEGSNSEWIELGTQHYVTISQISPGEYTFMIKGSNNDLVWAESPLKVKLIVKPSLLERLTSTYAYIVYIVVIALLIVVFWRIRTRSLRRANQRLKEKERIAKEVERQKEELSIKNTNITDSINYAKRILEAMMPSEKFFRKLLPESFIFFKPKDIVSGDFYWIAEKSGKIFVAAVDCTGHGIPGAFMSIIGFDLLRNIIKEQGIEQASQIVDKLNEGVAETFGKDQDDTEQLRVSDGMDLAFCVIDPQRKVIEYAGAFNPLYLIRDYNIVEYKADRFSVGLAAHDKRRTFTNHVIPYQENDIIYIFSDGYTDQFGGPKGKKFKFRRFRHLLLTIYKLPIEKQKAALKQSIENWIGDEDQIDDIMVIGINPSHINTNGKSNHFPAF